MNTISLAIDSTNKIKSIKNGQIGHKRINMAYLRRRFILQINNLNCFINFLVNFLSFIFSIFRFLIWVLKCNCQTHSVTSPKIFWMQISPNFHFCIACNDLLISILNYEVHLLTRDFISRLEFILRFNVDPILLSSTLFSYIWYIYIYILIVIVQFNMTLVDVNIWRWFLLLWEINCY